MNRFSTQDVHPLPDLASRMLCNRMASIAKCHQIDIENH